MILDLAWDSRYERYTADSDSYSVCDIDTIGLAIQIWPLTRQQRAGEAAAGPGQPLEVVRDRPHLARSPRGRSEGRVAPGSPAGPRERARRHHCRGRPDERRMDLQYARRTRFLHRTLSQV